MSREPWKGWALGNTALYIDQPPGSDNVLLYVQSEDVVSTVAIFVDADAASYVQAWLEHAISAVGQANAILAAGRG